MLNFHNSYYVIIYLFMFVVFNQLINLKFLIMDKRLVYKHIQMLQNFACAYRFYLKGVPMEFGVSLMFEVTKLYYDDSKNLRKCITFVVSHSNGEIPVFHDLGVFDIHVQLCDQKRINQLISQCNSFGIVIN